MIKEPTSTQEASDLTERLVRIRKMILRDRNTERRRRLSDAYARGLDLLLEYKRKRNRHDMES